MDWSFLPAEADAILVVPPFFSLVAPALGPELLAACASQAGLRVATAYVNLSFAAVAGLDRYYDFLRGRPELATERLFAEAAFGPSPRRGLEALGEYSGAARWEGLFLEPVPTARLRAVEPFVEPWLASTAAAIVERRPRVVGVSVSEGSLAVSYALAARIKKAAPGVIVVFGGPACAGSMSRGVLSLGPAIDAVFSGQAERTFVAFLQGLRRGARVRRGVVAGDRDVDLDALPPTDFSGHLEQARRFVPEIRPVDLILPCETCRGCCWAVRRACAFCGTDTHGWISMKSPATVARDVARLARTHPGRRIMFTDLSAPPAMLATVVSRWAAEPPGAEMIWSTRPDLTLAQVAALKAAGLVVATVGVESLSTRLLERLGKGTCACQSVAILRHCRSVGILAMWNLVGGIPGDRLDEYAEMVPLIPRLVHLQPPYAFQKVEVVRFSRYHDAPEEYRLSNLLPLPAWGDVFPSETDVSSLAFGFAADFASESLERPDGMEALVQEVERWQARWIGPPRTWPELSVRPLAPGWSGAGPGPFVLTDTRGLQGCEEQELLTRDEAVAALVEHVEPPAGIAEWALTRQVAVIVDGRYTPLATADPALILRLAGG